MRLHLVRHGQTYSNLAYALDTGAPGADLTEEGRRQARAVGALLSDAPLHGVFASHLTRARDTAAQVAAPHALQVEVREGLREILAGDLEMRTDEASTRRYLGVLASWTLGDLDVTMPGAEDGHTVLGRYDQVVEEVAATGVEQAALVSHGAVIRLWSQARSGNVDPRAAVGWELDNTGVVTLEGEPGDWRMLAWQGQAVPHLSATPGDGPAGRPLRVTEG